MHDVNSIDSTVGDGEGLNVKVKMAAQVSCISISVKC